MATQRALYTSHNLNTVASQANAAAHQIHKWLTEPDSSNSGAFQRGMKGGVEVCQFLSESLGAALVKPVQFDQLGLIAMLKPVRDDLERIKEDGGLEQLKKDADSVLLVLQELLRAEEQNNPNLLKKRAEEAKHFFRKVRDPFLKAATSSLLRNHP